MQIDMGRPAFKEKENPSNNNTERTSTEPQLSESTNVYKIFVAGTIYTEACTARSPI